jgi:HAD superfamily hydrolase (TIGR01509 family)
VLLLPLYPQYSTTTTGSSVLAWEAAARRAGLSAPTTTLCCFHSDPGFADATAAIVRKAWEEARAALDPAVGLRVLFSAHGLPESIVNAGDPYQWQVEQSVARIVERLGIEGLDHIVCYQSRVTPQKWIGPSTEEELERAGHDKVAVLVVPVAFTSEHSETLVELDVEYREEAEKLGVPGYFRAPAQNSDPAFIAALAGLVERARGGGGASAPSRVRGNARRTGGTARMRRWRPSGGRRSRRDVGHPAAGGSLRLRRGAGGQRGAAQPHPGRGDQRPRLGDDGGGGGAALHRPVLGGDRAAGGGQARPGSVPADFLHGLIARVIRGLREDLSPMPGALEAVEAIRAAGIPVAVASNSSRAELATKLARLSLAEVFRGRAFSTDDVDRPKPAPDMYRAAAEACGADPHRCVVVEDSLAGARAGRAAGCRVLGLAHATPAEAFRAIGAEPFHAMADLPELLALR